MTDIYYNRGINLPVTILIIIMAFVNGCGKHEPPVAKGPMEKVTISHSLTISPALLFIAQKKNFFTAFGIKAESLLHEYGKPALQSMIDGKADMAISGDTPIMFAISGKKQIHIIAVVATTKSNLAMVARKDRGVNTLSDLKGKRLGVSKGTTMHFFMDSFLSVHGIDKKSITIGDMTPPQLADSLLNGKLDAVTVINPWIKILEGKLGNSGTVFYEDSLYSDIICLSALREFTKSRPETVKKVVLALLAAEKYVKSFPEETKEIISGTTGIDKGIVNSLLKVSSYNLTLDQSLLVSLEDQTRWAVKNRLMTGKVMPKYLDHIYFQALQSAKPESVTIIR